ncbi:MAG: hypothetical protein H7A32_00680 [Deltaproteobacteria bacterium]|nr:hypothetical protein [Deltaproteobacteria bacterium]
MPRITEQHKNLATELLAVLDQFSDLPESQQDEVLRLLNRQGTYCEDFGTNIDLQNIVEWRVRLHEIESGNTRALASIMGPSESFSDSALVMVISDLAEEVDSYTGNTNHAGQLNALLQSNAIASHRGLMGLVTGTIVHRASTAIRGLQTTAEDIHFLEKIEERKAQFKSQKQWEQFLQHIADHPKHRASLREYRAAAFQLRYGAGLLLVYLDSLSPSQQPIFLRQVGLNKQDILQITAELSTDHPTPSLDLCKKLARIPLALKLAGFFETDPRNTHTKTRHFIQFEAQLNQAISRLETALEQKNHYHGSIRSLVDRDAQLALAVFGSSLNGRNSSEEERQATNILTRHFIDARAYYTDAKYWGAFMRSIETAPPAETTEHYKMRQIIYSGLRDHLRIIQRNLKKKKDQAPFNQIGENQRQRLLADLNILIVALDEALAGREALLLGNMEYTHELTLFACYNYMRTHRFLGSDDSKSTSGREALIYIQQHSAVADGELSKRAQITPRIERIAIWQSIETHLKTIDFDSILAKIPSEEEKTAIQKRWPFIQKFLRNASGADERDLLSAAASSTTDLHHIYRLLEHSSYFEAADTQTHLTFLAQVLDIPDLDRVKQSTQTSITTQTQSEHVKISQDISTRESSLQTSAPARQIIASSEETQQKTKKELSYHDASMSVEQLKALTQKVSPATIKITDKSFDRQIFTGLYHQLVTQLAAIESDITTKNELKVSLKLLTYLYLESVRHSSNKIRPPREDEFDKNLIIISRTQAENLIETMERLQEINRGHINIGVLTPCLRKLKSILDSIDPSASEIRVPLAAVAHAYRLRAENCIEISNHQARVALEAVEHYLHQFNISPERTHQDYLKLKKVLENKLTSNPKRVNLLNEEAALVVSALNIVIDDTHGPDYDQRIATKRQIKEMLRRKSYPGRKPEKSPQTAISVELFKKELRRTERLLEDKGTDGTLEAFKREFAQQMAIGGLHAEIFSLNEPSLHNLGFEANSFVDAVQIKPGEAKVPVKIYYTTRRGPTQEISHQGAELYHLQNGQYRLGLELIRRSIQEPRDHPSPGITALAYSYPQFLEWLRKEESIEASTKERLRRVLPAEGSLEATYLEETARIDLLIEMLENSSGIHSDQGAQLFFEQCALILAGDLTQFIREEELHAYLNQLLTEVISHFANTEGPIFMKINEHLGFGARIIIQNPKIFTALQTNARTFLAQTQRSSQITPQTNITITLQAQKRRSLRNRK